jgi:hypothetical protein
MVKTIDVNVTGYYEIWRLIIHSKVAIAVGVKVCSFPWVQRTKAGFVLFLLRTAREPRYMPDKLRLARDKWNRRKGLHERPYVSERALHRDRNSEEGVAIDLSAITFSVECCFRPLWLKLLIRSQSSSREPARQDGKTRSCPETSRRNLIGPSVTARVA